MNKILLSAIKQIPPEFRLDLKNTCIEHALCLNDSLNSFIKIISSNDLDMKSNENVCSSNKPLSGIPFALKDNFCTKGVHTTCGSKMLKDFVPMYNATVYEKLIHAGAVLIGKCNMDEFGMGSGCIDSMNGPTRNCWGYSSDRSSSNSRIPGGSSGGSAVAVASGACSFALGSDTGGSTRNPASYCGLVGLKPTYGLVSRYGLIPLVNSMDVPGIFTRSVEDCAMILNIIAGPDVMDSTTLKRPYQNVTLSQDFTLKNVRVGIPKEYYCSEMSSDVTSTWTYVADMLEKAGAIVNQVSMPNTSYSIAVYSILNQCEVSSNMARYDGVEYGLRPNVESIESTEQLYAESRSQGFNNVVKNRIIAGNYFLLDRNYEKYFLKAMKVRRMIAKDFEEIFYGKDSVDILLTPTTLSEAPTLDEFMKKENQDQCSVQDYCTQPANMSGVPAISIPIKLSSNSLPLSLQLMGPHLSEERLLNIASWIEKEVDFQNKYIDILIKNINIIKQISDYK